jgi:exopolysaccharide biosynthesis polyprenyl glycosylphosphotransferase
LPEPTVEYPRRGASRRDAATRRALAAADAVGAILALEICLALVGDDHVSLTGLAIAPLTILWAKMGGLYDRDPLLIHKTTADEIPAIFHMASATALLLWFFAPALTSSGLSSLQVAMLWVLLTAFTVGGRWSARYVLRRFASPERYLLIGDRRAWERLTNKLVDEGIKASLVARLEVSASQRADFDELRQLVHDLDVDRVIFVTDHSNPEGILDLVRATKGLGVHVTVLPGILEVVGSTVAFDNIGGMPLLGVRSFGMTRSSRLVKRGFDLAASATALFLAAPLFAMVAIAIRLDSAGSVFFRQERVGRHGNGFRIFKFRTMVPNAEELKHGLAERNEADGLFKIDGDPRITRVGRFLRQTSLDELPQLLNVFLGDMSIVGPRPLIADEDIKITGFDRRRLDLTPGITGHWQILGSARVPLAEMVKIDYLYVAGWTLWSDVKLILRTVPYVLARRGQ